MVNLNKVFKFLKISLICVFALTCLSAQVRVGDWKHYTSAMDMRDVECIGDNIYLASSGGLVCYNSLTEKFNIFDMDNGLSQPDIQCISQASDGKLWLGTGEPSGRINIWNTETKVVETIFNENTWDESLSSIADICFSSEKVYAAVQLNVDYGLLEFNLDNNDYSYKDFYFNFPLQFFEILDIESLNDTLWLGTDVGLFWADEDKNLKAPDSWEYIYIDSLANVCGILQFNNDIIIVMGNTISKFVNGSLQLLTDQLPRDAVSASVDNSGNLLVACNPYGTYKIDQDMNIESLGGQNTEYSAIDENGVVWSAIEDGGLRKYDGTESIHIPNTLLSNSNTALLFNSKNELVAGTKSGISFLTDNGWKNIVKSNNYDGFSNHENDNWNAFVSDTMIYNVSGRIYDIVESDNGSYFATLYNSYINNGRKGGVLTFDSEEFNEYTTLDTVNGYFTASEGVGSGNDHFLCVANAVIDPKKNIWYINHFAQNRNVVAVYSENEDEWYHFSIDDSGGKLTHLISSIVFDQNNRVWFSSDVNSELDASGGIIVLDFNNTLSDKSDDTWYRITTSNGLEDNAVYSMAFDQEETLWIMTMGGIQKANISTNFPSSYFSSLDGPYLENVSFAKELDIKVDGANNKWIMTSGNGVKVITSDENWWNGIDGLTVDNSEILSDNILDIVFDDDNGLAFISTDMGISVLKTPFASVDSETDELVVFPQPYLIPSEENLVIDGLGDDSEVKIITLNGQLVCHLTEANGNVDGSQAFWNGKDQNSRLVTSGVYICLVYSPTGKTRSGKIAVIRN